MITWDDPDARYFQHGIDRGVLYLSDGSAVAWNGITGFEESGNGAGSLYYIDGVIYLSDMDATDFEGTLKALFFPEEFFACMGMPEVTDGLYVDNQKPQRFGFSYRSLIGSGSGDDMFGYQIHLVYNAIASVETRDRKTINKSPEPMDFTFKIQATPVKMEGYRPTAHYVIDTRHLDAETISELEGILYGGVDLSSPQLPDINELFEMLNFGDAIVATVRADGFINYKGHRSNIYNTSATEYRVDNVNATMDSDGTYSVSDGGNTTVIYE